MQIEIFTGNDTLKIDLRFKEHCYEKNIDWFTWFSGFTSIR